MELDSFVDWGKYWHEVIEDQISILEDFEPKLVETDYSHIRMMMDIDDKELMIDDCEIRVDGCLICFGFGHDEDGVSLAFCIGKDNLINHVEFR